MEDILNPCYTPSFDASTVLFKATSAHQGALSRGSGAEVAVEAVGSRGLGSNEKRHETPGFTKENHRKMIGKWWLNGILWGLLSGFIKHGWLENPL